MEAILDDLYLAFADKDAARRLPAALARHLGGLTSALWLFDPGTGQPLSDLITNLPAEAAPLYVQHYHRIDPWMQPILGRPHGLPIHGSDLIADADLARTEYYNDFGRHAGTFHLTGAIVHSGPAPDGPAACLSVHRPKNAEDFTSADLERLHAIMPHLRRAVQLGETLVRSGTLLVHGTLETLLAAMPDPAFIATGAGHVVRANAGAEAADRAGTLALRARGAGGLLAAPHAGDNRVLLRAVADAATGGAGGLVPLGGTVAALVAPLPRAVAERCGAAGRILSGLVLVILRDARRPGPNAIAAATAMWRLTPAEAATAAALARGHAPTAIAAERGVAISTIRSLLRRAVEKAGASGLRDLARMIAALD